MTPRSDHHSEITHHGVIYYTNRCDKIVFKPQSRDGLLQALVANLSAMLQRL